MLVYLTSEMNFKEVPDTIYSNQEILDRLNGAFIYGEECASIIRNKEKQPVIYCIRWTELSGDEIYDWIEIYNSSSKREKIVLAYYQENLSSLLYLRNVYNWGELMKVLKHHKKLYEKRVWDLLDRDARRIISGFSDGNTLSLEEKRVIINALNRIIKSRNFYKEEYFRGLNGVDSLMRKAETFYNYFRIEDKNITFNRLLLDSILPLGPNPLFVRSGYVEVKDFPSVLKKREDLYINPGEKKKFRILLGNLSELLIFRETPSKEYSLEQRVYLTRKLGEPLNRKYIKWFRKYGPSFRFSGRSEYIYKSGEYIKMVFPVKKDGENGVFVLVPDFERRWGLEGYLYYPWGCFEGFDDKYAGEIGLWISRMEAVEKERCFLVKGRNIRIKFKGVFVRAYVCDNMDSVQVFSRMRFLKPECITIKLNAGFMSEEEIERVKEFRPTDVLRGPTVLILPESGGKKILDTVIVKTRYMIGWIRTYMFCLRLKLKDVFPGHLTFFFPFLFTILILFLALLIIKSSKKGGKDV